MLNILWFRRDLRVSDHLPLLMAVADGLVAPLVIVEPEYWAQPFASARQWRFTARAITALRSQLAVIGAPLVVRTGDAIECIQALQDKSQDVAIWSHNTVGSQWEVERDAKVAAWVQDAGIPWHRLPDTGGPDPSADDPWHSILTTPPSEPPDLMLAHGVTPGRVVSERILYLDDDPCDELPAGPAGARRVLDTFMTAAENGTAGDTEVEQAIAGLAPHLAWGTVSIRETWLELERLKPDEEAIAAQLQKRLLKKLTPTRSATHHFSTAETGLEQIAETLADLPLLSRAYAKLKQRGLIREDILAALVTSASTRLSAQPQDILNALAKYRTAFVETQDPFERYPGSDLLQGLTSADDINSALDTFDPGCLLT